MRNPLARLIQPRAERPSIRQRAASLKAGLARLSRKPVADAAALAEPAVERSDDAELLRLGSAFMEAAARADAAITERDTREDAANDHMPRRPTCLKFRAEDAGFPLRKYLQFSTGDLIEAGDIAWMTRRPMMRDQPRPVRADDNLPEGAHTVVDRVPWPEAQARVDEIVAAWAAWPREQQRVLAEHGVAEAEAAVDATRDAAVVLADRIAALPAHTAEGMRVKLRASAHYEDEHRPEYPGNRLLNSLLRDATKAPEPAELAAAPEVMALGFPVADLVGGVVHDDGTVTYLDLSGNMRREAFTDWLSFFAYQLHRAARRVSTQAFDAACAELEATEAQALDLRMHRDFRLDALHALAFRADKVPHSGDSRAWQAVQEHARATGSNLCSFPEAGAIADALNLHALPLSDLERLHDGLRLVDGLAGAMCSQPRSYTTEMGHSPVGAFASWLNDICGGLIDLCVKQARAAVPATGEEREDRAVILARSTIQNGDADDTRALARDIAALAEG